LATDPAFIRVDERPLRLISACTSIDVLVIDELLLRPPGVLCATG
jgi:hypothetical protein